MLPNIELAMQADALAIERARARVSAAIGNPLSPEDEGTFAVDLQSATFTSAREGRASFRGACQLIARQSKSDLWQWGFDQSDAPKIVTGDLRALVRGDAALFEISLSSPVAVPDVASAIRLATWIALRGGWTGACAASIGGRISFVALELVAVPHPEGPWCFSCGGAGPFFTRDGVSLCRSCSNDLRALGEPHPFDPRRVVFEGTLRTPADLVTLRAAFGSAPNLALTAPGIDETLADLVRTLCLFCGRSRGEMLVLNDGFTVCAACAEACANTFESS